AWTLPGPGNAKATARVNANMQKAGSTTFRMNHSGGGRFFERGAVYAPKSGKARMFHVKHSVRKASFVLYCPGLQRNGNLYDRFPAFDSVRGKSLEVSHVPILLTFLRLLGRACSLPRMARRRTAPPRDSRHDRGRICGQEFPVSLRRIVARASAAIRNPGHARPRCARP